MLWKAAACLVFAVALSPVAASAIFPAMRKRKLMEQKQMAEAAENANAPIADASKSMVPAESAPVTVPAVMDAGEDGNPQLPPVAHILNGAAITLKGLSSQTSALQAQVVQAQMQIEAKLARQKAAFEEKLKFQEQANLEIVATNNNISAEIKALETSNAALRKSAHDISESNSMMRTQLQNLQLHMADAKNFVGKSLTITDDSKTSMLAVLRPGHDQALVTMSAKGQEAESGSDDDDADTGDESDGDQDESENESEGTSLLALASTKVSKQTPAKVDVKYPDASDNADSVLAVLSQEVSRLKQQEKESEEQLKQLFIKDFRAGSLRKKALMAQQKTLDASRTHLSSLQSQLMKAEAHLKATHNELKARLHGLGQFLQKLAHVALAPQHEVPHLLEVLPKSVAVHS